jgi:hypothetical protein
MTMRQFSVGDKVSYHPIVGGAAESHGHEITHIELQPNNFGRDVAWVTGKRGCVALDALSNDRCPPVPPKPRLSRSQKRYRAYRSSESDEPFGDWLKNRYWDDYRARHGA